jgi:hypothetical protein
MKNKDRKSTHESGMAGEFFVMEALYRLGHEPALTLGNAKLIDILVQTKKGATKRISVKAIRGGGKWGVGDANLSKQKELFFVLLATFLTSHQGQKHMLFLQQKFKK